MVLRYNHCLMQWSLTWKAPRLFYRPREGKSQCQWGPLRPVKLINCSHNREPRSNETKTEDGIHFEAPGQKVGKFSFRPNGCKQANKVFIKQIVLLTIKLLCSLITLICTTAARKFSREARTQANTHCTHTHTA